jgi:hypothetical protein
MRRLDSWRVWAVVKLQDSGTTFVEEFGDPQIDPLHVCGLKQASSHTRLVGNADDLPPEFFEKPNRFGHPGDQLDFTWVAEVVLFNDQRPVSICKYIVHERVGATMLVNLLPGF